MFEADNKMLSANYNLVWTNMKDRVIQAFINLYGDKYNSIIREVIDQIKFVHIAKDETNNLEDKFLDLYEKIRISLISYRAISVDASVKDVLNFSREYAKKQLVSYYIDSDFRAFDQLTSKIIECAYYYSAVRNRQVITYGNQNGKYIIEFNDYYIPLEELFSKINQMFCHIDYQDTLMGIFNNLFAREMTSSFISMSSSIESIVQLGSIQRYTNIYDALYNDNKSILENMFIFYHDYIKQLFIENKYSDFIFFFGKNDYDKLNIYLNECIEKISLMLYSNPNINMSFVLNDEEKNKGVNLLNSIYSKLSLKTLKKITN